MACGWILKSPANAAISSVAVISTITLLTYIYKTRKKPHPDLPGLPKSQPIWHMLLFGVTSDPEDSSHYFAKGQQQKFIEKVAECGDLARYYIFGEPYINVADAGFARMILSNIKQFQRESVLMDSLSIVSKALFTLEGPIWKSHRQAMSPAFDQQHLQMVTEITVKKVHQLIHFWGSSKTVEIRDGASRVTLDTLGLVMYSYDFQCTVLQDPPAMRAIASMFEALALYFMMPKLVWRFHPARKQFFKGRQVICDTIAKTLAQKSLSSRSKNVATNDMLDILATEGKLSQADIMEEAIGLYFAGYETAAATLTFALYHMIIRPEVMQRAREEVEEVIGQWEPTFVKVNQLRYIDGCVKESLRFNPTISGITRTNINPFEHEGMTFPKNTNFAIDFRSLAQNPKYFDDPKAFKPERWLNVSDWFVPGSFVPFLDGPHRCIGEKMAMLEIKTTLAMLISHYDFELVAGEDFEVYYAITAFFKGGLNVHLTPRQKVG